MKGKLSIENQPLYTTWKWVIRAYTAKQMVESRWLDFWVFAEDVGEYPGKDYKFHRRDFSKPYGPQNWRWRHKYVSTPEAREKRKLYMRYWKAKRIAKEPDYEADMALKKKFGMSVEDYNKALAGQNGVCAICKGRETSIANQNNKVRRLTVDHCHSTGKIRGLLCSRCNRGLGFFRDNPKNLQNAIKYLEGCLNDTFFRQHLQR